MVFGAPGKGARFEAPLVYLEAGVGSPRAPSRAPKRFDGGVRELPSNAVFVPDYGPSRSDPWSESVLTSPSHG